MLMCFTGCNSLVTKSNITSLLSAPKLNQNEREIVAAIESYIGDTIIIKYSQNQGYSAPIQLTDIDYDGEYEAIVFYYAPNKGANIRFAMLSYEDENWQIVMDKEGLGTEVFYFDTIVLPNVRGRQITVGYQSANIDENFFVVYFTDMDKQLADYAERCQNIVTGDLTGNGYHNIILTRNASNKYVSLIVLDFTEQLSFKNIGTKSLRYSGPEIEQIKINQIKAGGKAVYVDYSDSHNHIHTEVFAIKDGRIVSCLDSLVITKNWEHETVINSVDINRDGILETATVIPPTHLEEVPTFRYLEWADWTLADVQRIYYGIYDIRENMFMALPDEWQDNIHAVALDNGFEIVNSETDEKMIKFEEKESINDIQVNTYSYAVYMGTRLWHLECDESMSEYQVEYVYKSITDLN